MFPWSELSTITLQNVCRELNARRTADRAREDALELLHTLELGVSNAIKRQQSMPPPPKRKYQRRTPALARTPAPFPMPPPTPVPTPVPLRKRGKQRAATPQVQAPVITRLESSPQIATRLAATNTRSTQSATSIAVIERIRAPPRPDLNPPNHSKKRKVFDGVEVDFPPSLRRYYLQRCQLPYQDPEDVYSDQVSTPGAELEEDSQSVHSDDILSFGRV